LTEDGLTKRIDWLNDTNRKLREARELAEARIAELEALVRETYPMIVYDAFGCGVEITDFQFWKRRAVLIVPPPPVTSNPTPFQA